MRLGFFEPSRWRLPECMRITLPVDVSLNRFAAPRCVFSLIFVLGFLAIMPSLRYLPAANSHAWPGAADALGREAEADAPFFGASNARIMFASMRGPNSTSA